MSARCDDAAPLAARILAMERSADAGASSAGPTVERCVGKLRIALEPLVGGGAFDALLTRAIGRAIATVPALAARTNRRNFDLRVLIDGTEAGMRTILSEAIVAEFVQEMLELLGDTLTMRLVENIWQPTTPATAGSKGRQR